MQFFGIFTSYENKWCYLPSGNKIKDSLLIAWQGITMLVFDNFSSFSDESQVCHLTQAGQTGVTFEIFMAFHCGFEGYIG